MNDTVAATSLEQLADEIAHALARATILYSRAYIRTPVLFPSGATAVVVIEEEGGGRYRVSDLGQGFDEASQLGVASFILLWGWPPRSAALALLAPVRVPERASTHSGHLDLGSDCCG